MKRGPTGRYEVTTSSGETVRAFVPRPLPPSAPLQLDTARNRRFEKFLLGDAVFTHRLQSLLVAKAPGQPPCSSITSSILAMSVIASARAATI
jgi:hypothetical protein